LNLKPGIREKPIHTITQGGGMQNSCRSEIEMQERNPSDTGRARSAFCLSAEQYFSNI